ncbi:MAG: hypothetical protein IPL88_06515 [Rhizobiales bacterium]|nr:hypothetical protein [Hyphomicrobiales bacterium]
MPPKIRRRASRLGARFVKDGLHTAETLSARLPMLMTPAGDLAERSRMVTEKFEAAAQGMAAATLELGSFWMKAMFGGVRGPMDVLAGMMDVAAAATEPASRKVQANAKRLRRR